jgi:hypothetical protein
MGIVALWVNYRQLNNLKISFDDDNCNAHMSSTVVLSRVRMQSVVSFLWLLLWSMTSCSIYAVSASFFSSRCDYDSFVDYLSYGKQDHIDTSQLSFIVKVENFCDVEDIPVVFWLYVSMTKHFKLCNFV